MPKPLCVAKISVVNGIHLRVAGRIAQLRTDTPLFICKNGKCVDAIDILQVLQLAVVPNDIIEVKTVESLLSQVKHILEH